MSNILPQDPSQQAYQARMFQELAALPGDMRNFIAAKYAATEITVLPLPYWSTVRFLATRAAGPPVAFTIDTTQRRAFSYAIGGDMSSAGFAAGTIATQAETNLLQANTTRDNADIWIWGIACSLLTTSEPVLASRVWRESDISIALNGTTQIPLGRLEMFPGAGGLYGFGNSYLRAPALNVAGISNSGEGSSVSYISNGNPQSSNYKRFPQPFKWAALGSTGSDSSLQLLFTPRRSITESMTARAAVAGAAPGLSGQVEAATPPAAAGDAGTFVDVNVQLICVAVSKRSVNT